MLGGMTAALRIPTQAPSVHLIGSPMSHDHRLHLTVFGATGSVGRHVVDQALAQGHLVTAFTRHPGSIEPATGLEVVGGDVLDPMAVRAAVEGRDAVVVALGDGRRGGVREAGTRTIVQAMTDLGVRRLVCQSTLGAGDSRGNLDLVWKYLMFGLLLRKAYADHQRQEDVVRASGLDWTILRPAAFTDGPTTGSYRHGFGPDDRSTTLKISRADVAHALLRQVTDSTGVGRAVSVSY